MRWLPYAAPALAVVVGFQLASAAPSIPNISKLTSAKIHTLTMDSEVVKENRPELEKIGGDFAQAYRFHRVSISYKQPGKIQFEATVAGAHITYTINGNKRFTAVPTFHVHKVEDISGAPGKKQSLLDCGLLAPEVLQDFDGIFERRDGNQLVFRMQPKARGERFHEEIWIDPVTHIVTKRERYNQDGKLMSWYRYLNPVEPRPKMYVPTRVEVYNPENRLAGVTVYRNIKVNLGVEDSVFDF
jgi:outer membrane lipoprotein-sorting protein